MGLLRLVATLITVLVATGTVALVITYWLFARDIGEDLARLLAQARPSGVVITEGMLAPLPAPAQRYLRYAGVLGTAIPRTIRLTQSGRIRSSAAANWMNFEADETYSTNPPAFIWRTWLPARLMPMAFGRDEYLEGKGSILIKLLGLVPVADENGTELAAAGLMRYLNETMWFPAALLGPNVRIAPVDANSFRAVLADRGLSAEALFLVDAEGRLVNFRAQRFNTASRSIETWETPVDNYETVAGLKLPTAGTAVWKLGTGDLAYIELRVTGIVHD